MNCHSFRAVMHSLDEPEYLEQGIRDAALLHLEECARCARRVAGARQLSSGLRHLALADSGRQPSPQVEARLLLFFRARQSRRLRRNRLAWGLAAAAAVAVALGVGLLWQRQVRPSPARSVRSTVVAGSEVASSRLSPAAEPANDEIRRGARLTPSGSDVDGLPQSSEDLAEFLPLPFADNDAPLGAAEVVRIRLPESALSQLGLAVTEDALSQPVTADVVIGEDGAARAIRFVSENVPARSRQQAPVKNSITQGVKR